MVIYSNGCSHTAGHRERFKSHIKHTAYQLMKDFKVLDITHPVYTVKLNYDNYFQDDVLFFDADSGKSNDLIFFETYSFITNSIQKGVHIDYSIIQWSGVNRRLHTKFDGNLLYITPHDNFELGIKFEPLATTQTIQYMHILQNLFESNNIEYAFIPYMGMDVDIFNEFHLSKKLNLSKFTTHPATGHLNDFLKNGMTVDEEGHPSELGSYELSKLTLSVLDKKELIISHDDLIEQYSHHNKDLYNKLF